MYRRARIVLLGAHIIMVILLSIRFYLTAELAAKDVEFAKVIIETRRLKQSSLILKEKVLRESALATIDRKARAMGFVTPSKTVYIRTALKTTTW